LARIALGCILTAASAVSAFASPQSVFFTYREPAGTAVASGYITFETTLISNPGNNTITLPDPSVLAISLTVSGATSGNGTYTMADFGQVFFNTGTVGLDLSKPLIGQSAGGGFIWGTCTGGNCGDLNFFGIAAPAPTGTFWFALTADGGAANTMNLAAAGPPGNQAPTMSEWMLILLAVLLAGTGMVMARKRLL